MHDMAQDALLNLALAVITLLSTYALHYIRKAVAKVSAETAKIRNDDRRALVQAAIARLDDVATKTVKMIEQTTAKELRRAVKHGQASREDLVGLAKRAYDEIYRALSPEYIQALSGTLGDLDAYIRSTIEAKVLELKQSAAITDALELQEGA
jgi:hypothetical protein